MERDRYWFPAKRHGWGWGLPTVWQGWLALTVFFGAVAAGAFFFPPGSAAAIVYVIVACVLFTGLCWLKGEPPRWRWGDKE
jgi:hypothetical protein